jgi:hypothetical protein
MHRYVPGPSPTYPPTSSNLDLFGDNEDDALTPGSSGGGGGGRRREAGVTMFPQDVGHPDDDDDEDGPSEGYKMLGGGEVDGASRSEVNLPSVGDGRAKERNREEEWVEGPDGKKMQPWAHRDIK